MDFFALSLGKALCDASTAIVYGPSAHWVEPAVAGAPSVVRR
jgi:hypothetical protein